MIIFNKIIELKSFDNNISIDNKSAFIDCNIINQFENNLNNQNE